MVGRGLRTLVLTQTLVWASCGAPQESLGAEAPFEIDDVEHFLVSVNACEPPEWSPLGTSPRLTTAFVAAAMFDDAFVMGVRYLEQPMVSACLAATHGDCDAVMACLGFGSATSFPGQGCGYAGSCAGSVAQVSCADPFFDAASGTTFSARYTESCSTAGNTCDPRAGECRRPCAAGSWVCSADGSVAECPETSTSVTCPAGTTCVAGEGSCAPTASRSCTRSVCDGDVAWDCVGGELTRRFACSSAGMRCDDPSGHCVAASSECVPDESRCDGDVLTYCGPGGTVRRYDCVAHGWASCTGTFCVAARPWLVPP